MVFREIGITSDNIVPKIAFLLGQCGFLGGYTVLEIVDNFVGSPDALFDFGSVSPKSFNLFLSGISALVFE